MKFRIEIRELNSGKKQYIPQAYVTEEEFLSNDYVLPNWLNIIRSRKNNISLTLSPIFFDAYNSEELALKRISEFKIAAHKELMLKTKKVTYKEVE